MPGKLREGDVDIAMHVCGDGEIPDVLLRPVHEMDIAEDARPSELVLVLEIRAIGVFEHDDSEPILPVLELVGDIELGGAVRDLAIADEGAVEIDEECRIHAFEVEIAAPAAPLLLLEVEDVGSRRVVRRNIRRIVRNRIVDVRVLLLHIPERLEGGRHMDGIERRGIIVLADEVPIDILRRWIDLQAPAVSGEQKGCRAAAFIERHAVCAASLGADMLHRKILIVSFKLHGSMLSI